MPQSHLIQSVEALTTRYSTPSKPSRAKVHERLSANMQTWLQHSPFFVLSSVGDGGLDCSPRGDAPGSAFHILNDKTLAIPDRTGNNRIDTLKNILADKRVGLLFLIPGVEEALRIKGTAALSIEPSLLERFALDGTLPATVIIITIETVYVQNARAVRRSKLWNPASSQQGDNIPSFQELSGEAGYSASNSMATPPPQ